MMYHINNWSLVTNPNASPYHAPEVAGACLHGNVSGHPDFKDGDLITTSPVRHIIMGVVVTASGSEYELGSADPNYLEMYPNAVKLWHQDLEY